MPRSPQDPDNPHADLIRLVERFATLRTRAQDPSSSPAERNVAARKVAQMRAEHPAIDAYADLYEGKAKVNVPPPRPADVRGATVGLLDFLWREARDRVASALGPLEEEAVRALNRAGQRARERARVQAERMVDQAVDRGVDRFFDQVTRIVDLNDLDDLGEHRPRPAPRPSTHQPRNRPRRASDPEDSP